MTSLEIAMKEPLDLPEGECCVCHMKLKAPWGRNGHFGQHWTCGKNCQDQYDREEKLSWTTRLPLAQNAVRR